MYVCVYIYIYIYIHVYVYIYIYISMYLYNISLSLFISLSLHIYIYICRYRYTQYMTRQACGALCAGESLTARQDPAPARLGRISYTIILLCYSIFYYIRLQHSLLYYNILLVFFLYLFILCFTPPLHRAAGPSPCEVGKGWWWRGSFTIWSFCPYRNGNALRVRRGSFTVWSNRKTLKPSNPKP